MLGGLEGIKRIVLFGPRDMARNVGIFSFTIRGRDVAEAARELESRHGVMTRAGLHCAPSAHRTIGTYPEGTIRASIGCFTTGEEVAGFLASLREICDGR